MTDIWRESIDQGGTFSDFLTDLSKSLYCLIQELLVAKFHACHLDISLLLLLYCY